MLTWCRTYIAADCKTVYPYAADLLDGYISLLCSGCMQNGTCTECKHCRVPCMLHSNSVIPVQQSLLHTVRIADYVNQISVCQEIRARLALSSGIRAKVLFKLAECTLHHECKHCTEHTSGISHHQYVDKASIKTVQAMTMHGVTAEDQPTKYKTFYGAIMTGPMLPSVQVVHCSYSDVL